MASFDEFTSSECLLLNQVGEYYQMYSEKPEFSILLQHAYRIFWPRIAVSFKHLQVAPLPRIPTFDSHDQIACLMDDSSYRLNFDLGKKNEIHHYS